MLLRAIIFSAGVFLALTGPSHAFNEAAPAGVGELVAQYASANGIPAALVHRVIQAESKYNARAVHHGFYGLMQISYATARSMGYAGSSAGLLDANTNLAVAVPYLANAYLVAGGNADRAIRLYRSGFYYAAKRRGLLGRMVKARPIARLNPLPQLQTRSPNLPPY
jgi:soluble lytic murein transglycosylase-like protein